MAKGVIRMQSKGRAEWLRKLEDLKKKILEFLSDKAVSTRSELWDFLRVNDDRLFKAAFASLSAKGKIVVEENGYTLSTSEARERYKRYIEAQRNRVKAIIRE